MNSVGRLSQNALLIMMATLLYAGAVSAGPPKKVDMGIGALDLSLIDEDRELMAFVPPETEKLTIFVQVTATSTPNVESIVPGRKLEVVATQDGKEVGRTVVKLENGDYMTGKRRFAFALSAKIAACVPISVAVAIVGQPKKATKTASIPTACGD